MPYSFSGRDPVSDRGGRHPRVTLAPLATGRSALAPKPGLAVTAALLIQLEKRWHDAFNQVTVHKAFDLFACADGNLAPKGVELVEAVLEIHLAGSPEPRYVCLKPPDILIVQDPQFETQLVSFLAARGFVSFNA